MGRPFHIYTAVADLWARGKAFITPVSKLSYAVRRETGHIGFTFSSFLYFSDGLALRLGSLLASAIDCRVAVDGRVLAARVVRDASDKPVDALRPLLRAAAGPVAP